MREIKFRGKRLDNSEWVYGDLLKPFKSQFYVLDYSKFDYDCFEHIGEVAEQFEVVPETVGQFTGLLDKNGKEIYEGDIVRERWNNYTPIYQNAIYMAYNVDKINDPYVSTQFNVIWRNCCEVIGNIHDNPELLEVKK